jgi:hypothetical protein
MSISRPSRQTAQKGRDQARCHQDVRRPQARPRADRRRVGAVAAPAPPLTGDADREPRHRQRRFAWRRNIGPAGIFVVVSQRGFSTRVKRGDAAVSSGVGQRNVSHRPASVRIFDALHAEWEPTLDPKRHFVGGRPTCGRSPAIGPCDSTCPGWFEHDWSTLAVSNGISFIPRRRLASGRARSRPGRPSRGTSCALQLRIEHGKRRTTGMKKGMKESYIEVLATRGGPDHALVTREGAAKRWIGVHAGRAIEPRNGSCPGCRRAHARRKATPPVALSRVAGGPPRGRRTRRTRVISSC